MPRLRDRIPDDLPACFVIHRGLDVNMRSALTYAILRPPASIGGLAVGNEAAEDLFILAALVSKERMRIIISPTNLRLHVAPMAADQPPWTEELYSDIQQELGQYQRVTSPLQSS